MNKPIINDEFIHDVDKTKSLKLQTTLEYRSVLCGKDVFKYEVFFQII